MSFFTPLKVSFLLLLGIVVVILSQEKSIIAVKKKIETKKVIQETPERIVKKEKHVFKKSLAVVETPKENLIPKAARFTNGDESSSSKEEDKENDDEFFEDTEYYALGSEETFLVTKAEIKAFFPKGVPREINITKNGVANRFIHPNKIGTGDGVGKTAYFADEESVQQYAEYIHREETWTAFRKITEENVDTKKEVFKPELGEKLPPNAFVINDFIPGTTSAQTGNTVSIPSDIYERVSKVNFSFNTTEGQELADLLQKQDDDVWGSDEEDGGYTEIDFEDSKINELAAEVSRPVLSFGNGGELSVEVKEGSVLVNGKGHDFAVFENVFRIQERHKKFGEYFFELGLVGVSKDDQNYFWYPCDLQAPLSKNGDSFCAGITPTSSGGNVYDLAFFGERGEAFRYLKIRDANDKDNDTKFAEVAREDATGFDLDAVRLINVFEAKEEK